jgi:cytochrome P450/NADPH-cytochrome P450 reductase
MEPDMRAELMSLFRERTGAGGGEALRWIEEMGTSSRYVLDVWSDNLR